MTPLLRALLTAPIEPPTGDAITDFWPVLLRATAEFPHSMDRAALGGFVSDRLGYAFSAGYHAALRALVPALEPSARVALCATESTGGRPRDIATTLQPTPDGAFTLTGHKSWVTLGAFAETLLVVASEGTDDQQRNRLRVVSVPARSTGVRTSPMPPTPFVPEIPHCEVHFDRVAIPARDVLPGDGFDQYVKPFRTVEDCHVFVATLGHLVRVAREASWPTAVCERLIADIVTFRTVGSDDPRAPETHIALAGAIASARRTVESLADRWPSVDPQISARWDRDRPLLQIANTARTQRAERAWQTLRPAR